MSENSSRTGEKGVGLSTSGQTKSEGTLGLGIPIWFRALLMVVGFGLFYVTQNAISGAHISNGEALKDRLFDLFLPVNEYLRAHMDLSKALIVTSSALIDAMGLYIIVKGFRDRSMSLLLGVLGIYALRQACVFISPLPIPENMIWPYPGFPSLLVSYSVTNDMFFSGHLAFTTFGAIAIVKANYKSAILKAAAYLVTPFQFVLFLMLQAHYTLDMVTGCVVGAFFYLVMEKYGTGIEAAALRRFWPGRVARAEAETPGDQSSQVAQ